ncbi:hypothetical protein, partial [Escherichia coli]
ERTTKKITQIPINKTYLKHIINTLTNPINNQNKTSTSKSQLIKSPTPNIISKHSIYKPLQTKLITINSIIPIKHNQQKLI